MAITLRLTKGSELTYAELDGNFTDLDTRINALPDSSQVSGIILNDVDSAYVQARQVDVYRDSGFITNIIDSAYVQARQIVSGGGGAGGVDSATVSTIITSDVDSAYVQTRQDFAYASLTGKPDLGRTQLTIYTVATLPTGGTEGELIYVQDGDAGSPCLAVLDGLGDYKVVSTFGSTVLDSGGGF